MSGILVYKIVDAEGLGNHLRIFESSVAREWANKGYRVLYRLWYQHADGHGYYERTDWQVWAESKIDEIPLDRPERKPINAIRKDV